MLFSVCIFISLVYSVPIDIIYNYCSALIHVVPLLSQDEDDGDVEDAADEEYDERVCFVLDLILLLAHSSHYDVLTFPHLLLSHLIHLSNAGVNYEICYQDTLTIWRKRALKEFRNRNRRPLLFSFFQSKNILRRL